MKITIDRKQAAIAVAKIARALSEMQPSLQIAVVRAAGDHATFEARAGSLTLSITTPARVDAEGETCVAVGELLKLLRAMLGYAFVEVETRETATGARQVRVSAGATEALIDEGALENLPAVTDATGAEAAWSASCETLVVALSRAVAVAAEDSTRGLACVLLEPVDGHLRVVATDGNCLLWTSVGVEAGGGETPVLLPRHAADVASACLAGLDGSVAVARSASAVRIEDAGVVLVARLQEGRFVPYREVLPQAGLRDPIVVDRALLLAAAQRCARFSGLICRDTVIEVDRNVLRLTARRMSEVIHEEIGKEDGGAWGLTGVNASIFAKLLGATQGETVALEWGGHALAPIQWRPAPSDSLVVLMPIRLD